MSLSGRMARLVAVTGTVCAVVLSFGVADVHAQASLPWIASGSYEGEHWLASFAVYLLGVPA